MDLAKHKMLRVKFKHSEYFFDQGLIYEKCVLALNFLNIAFDSPWWPHHTCWSFESKRHVVINRFEFPAFIDNIQCIEVEKKTFFEKKTLLRNDLHD